MDLLEPAARATPTSGTTQAIWLHATCVELGGAGIVLLGPSGSGKSDLALRLIDRGARLVADDQLAVERQGDRLLGRPAAALAGLLEVRGFGIVKLPWQAVCPLGLAVGLYLARWFMRAYETEGYRWDLRLQHGTTAAVAAAVLIAAGLSQVPVLRGLRRQLHRARGRPGRPRLLRMTQVGIGRQVEQRRRDQHPRDAIRERVVHLEEHGGPIVLESLEHVELPERPPDAAREPELEHRDGPARPDDACQLAQRRGRVVDVPQQVGEGQPVEPAVLERQLLGVALDPVDLDHGVRRALARDL